MSYVTIVFYDKVEDGIKRRGDFFWSVVDFSFEKDTIGHIFTGQYYGLHNYRKITPTRKNVIIDKTKVSLPQSIVT